MVRILVVKHIGALKPIDDAGEAVIRKLGQGEIVTVELKRERNIQHHRKLFAMLQIILENQDAYKSVDDLLDVCKLRIGHVRTVQTKEGIVRIPDSISFASMDQDSFNQFYDKACGWVITEVIPGLQRKDLDEEVADELRAFGQPEG